MIDRIHDLSIARRAKALNISPGSVYYQPRPVSAEGDTRYCTWFRRHNGHLKVRCRAGAI
jgi:hypothetical protein